MLVQLFTKPTDRNDESMAESCCLMVDVCTGAIDERWFVKTTTTSNRAMMQCNFTLK